jgi:hypothetical protein
MFYVYGAQNSRATDRTELLLSVCRRPYKLFILGEDFSKDQLLKLIPETTFIPHIFENLNYVGGIKELYDYLYGELKIENFKG